MPAALGPSNYGKSRVRLFRVTRDGERHDVADLTVDVAFEGKYRDVHLQGDNAAVLPTDTMRNTVYALAKQHPVTPVEGFGRALAEHFLGATEECDRVRIRIATHGWERIAVGGRPHRHSFVRGSGERRMAYVFADRDSVRFEAGIEDLEVLKTTQSAFEGYIKDRYTTLPETRDRIFATIVSARWKYASAPADFDAAFAAVRTAMLETFAEHESKSVQQTLYAMGAAALDAAPEIPEIRLSLPNRHHLLFDIGRFGLENRNEVFVPTPEPFGLIEATVVRTE
ncbi:factor-independent urate hydroxylase [Longimicrobium sp.]|uniref:factor-independent urate hydroxylase n=1 Tax=Longimicrobium sp. TaxID=2029185 RepID=UPI002CD5A18D|nr:urate oxidase [Longimicrobium sp.]HSU15363.1 urate oxidase [Longimicrobium sp.]